MLLRTRAGRHFALALLTSTALVYALGDSNPALKDQGTQTSDADSSSGLSTWWGYGLGVSGVGGGGGLDGLDWTTVDDWLVWLFEWLARMVGRAWHVVRSNDIMKALLAPVLATVVWSIQGWTMKKLEQFFLYQISFSDAEQIYALQGFLALHHQDASVMTVSRQHSSSTEGGFAKALFDIGEMYHLGTEKNVEKSEKEAVIWYRKAAAQGSHEAKTALSQLDPSAASKRVVENSTFRFRSQLDSKPCAINFSPSPSNSGLSSFIWMAGESSWRLPFIQIKGANVDSALWQSLPDQIKTLYNEFESRIKKLLQYEINEYGERVPDSPASNDLIVSSMRWNGHLVRKCVNDAILLHKKQVSGLQV
jgi:hypothetical protein